MKLVELKPKWTVTDEYGLWDEKKQINPKRHGMGITFICPVCKNHRLGVWFQNPIDGYAPAFGTEILWRRTGESFETLTLTPSIDATKNAPPLSPSLHIANCFHGFITNGEVG